MAERFYVSPGDFREDKVHFSAEQAKYIRKVLRLKEGAEVVVTNGLGQAYLCRLLFPSRDAAEGLLTAPLTGGRNPDPDPGLRVVLYQGLPKGDKMDQVVQKCVELGAAEIVPLLTRRCVVRLEGARGEERRRRWQRIAAAALEQSGRNLLPRVREPVTLARALAEVGEAGKPGEAGEVRKPGEAGEVREVGKPGKASPAPEATPGRARALGGTLALMPWEEEASRGMGSFLAANPRPREVRIFIGPEGGFSPEEAEEAAGAGVALVTLGPRILRTETAGPAALALVLYHYGELGQGGSS